MAKKKSRSQRNKQRSPASKTSAQKPLDSAVAETANNENSHNEPINDPAESTEERVLRRRKHVQSVLQKLLDQETTTRKRLKNLEVQLKPLHKTAQKVRENTDLSGEKIISLWKQAKANGTETADKISAQTENMRHQQERGRILELVMLRQCNLIDALTVTPSRKLEKKFDDDQSRCEAIEMEAMVWLHQGEQRYFGIEPPHVEPSEDESPPQAESVSGDTQQEAPGSESTGEFSDSESKNEEKKSSDDNHVHDSDSEDSL